MAAYGTVTVSTTAILILPANPNRKSYLICNTNTSVKLYIGPDSGITSSTGFEISSSGNIAEDFNAAKQVYTGPVWGIAASAIDVRFWERI